jgi:DNA-binding CsgD family transcriptional regulator
LLVEGRIAEELYRDAIERLGRSHVVIELARAHLVYGEWLRRERRRIEAREQLRTADDMFSAMGAHVFAQRARRELLATGESARRRTVDTSRSLTKQEQQIVFLARGGCSNQEIASQLFISMKTVEYHLHKAFTKLGINSRYELAHVLPEAERAA